MNVAHALWSECGGIKEGKEEEEVPLVSKKRLVESCLVFQLSERVLLCGLHQRTVCLAFVFDIIEYDYQCSVLC